MPDPYSAGIGIANGLAETVVGLINNKKAKAEARKLERSRPQYEISDLYQQGLDLAESEAASGGISSRAERAYNNLKDKQFSSSLGAILRGGGSVNNVADVFGESEEGRQRLALLSDEMRMNQLNNLTRARQTMADQQDKAFMYNIDAPWKDKAQAASAARSQAQKNIWGGIGQIASAGMGFAGQQYDENQWNKYFNPPQNNQTATATNAPVFSLGRTLNPSQMGAGSSYPTFTRQQPIQPMNYSRDYWSPEQEQMQFREDFGLNYY